MIFYYPLAKSSAVRLYSSLSYQYRHSAGQPLLKVAYVFALMVVTKPGASRLLNVTKSH